MKTSVVMLFSLLMISLSLTGQTKSYRYPSQNKIPRTSASNYPLYRQQMISHNSVHIKAGVNINKNANLMADLNQDSFVQDTSENEFSSKNIISENTFMKHFNGTMPYIKPGSNWKMPTKRPDTSVNYYLRIMGVTPCRNHK